MLRESSIDSHRATSCNVILPFNEPLSLQRINDAVSCGIKTEITADMCVITCRPVGGVADTQVPACGRRHHPRDGTSLLPKKHELEYVGYVEAPALPWVVLGVGGSAIAKRVSTAF